MTDVKFLRGLAVDYANLETKDSKTFYYLTDSHKLYLGEYELTTKDSVQAAVNLVNNETKGIEALYSEIQKLEGDSETVGSIAYLLAALKAEIEGEVVNTLTAADNSITVDNTDATNPTVAVKISATSGNALSLENDGLNVTIPASTDYTVSIAESTPSGVAKRYTVAQGPTGSQTTIGTIDIPLDMVVEEGSVVDITFNAEDGKLYDGQTDVTEKIKGEGGTATAADAGKYIKLEIANSSADVLYIAAKDLVDVYTAEQNAAQVQLAINNNVISATIVAGSVGTTELDATVNASLAKADSAIQSVIEGTTNGTISVDGTDVAVHGLGSAAYAATTDFDGAGSAAAALTSANTYTDNALTWGSIPTQE